MRGQNGSGRRPEPAHITFHASRFTFHVSRFTHHASRRNIFK
ncbi:hypothetical protein QUF80_02210 [Desulfococcaceae bacterium HSG8]|nr:hypothetical protein [Desulfococcaceae bacterium HSG8]